MVLQRFFLLFFVCTAVSVQGQSRYRFYTLNMEQGLSSDVAWAVCKDKFNYVWIGTQNGVNRYDGHRIKQYFHNAKDSFSAPGNSVYWIHKDADGDLWFSFGWQGVARYNYVLDRFERFAPFDSAKAAHKYPAPVWRVNSDRQGRIYFACGGAAFRYTKSSGKMEDLTPLFNGAIESYGVGMFVPQGNNLLWVVSGNGLFRYDLVKSQIRHIPFDKDRFGFGEQEMHDAEFVNDHEMLVSVVRTGFLLFDTRTETFRMPPSSIDPSQSKNFSETGGVLKDSKGRIWLANSRYGLLEYFPKTNATYSLKAERSYPYPYAEQEGKGLNVYEDDEGTIWYCSSARGVIWFHPETDFVQVFQRDFSQTQTLPDNNVTFFLPLQTGKMMIGTGKGVAEFDEQAGRFRPFPVALNDKDVFPHPTVRCLLQSGDKVYISTYRGLSVYNQKTGTFARHLENSPDYDSAFGYSGLWLLHLLNGNLFVTGDQPSRFDPDTKKFTYGPALKTDPLYSLRDVNASFWDERRRLLWLEAGNGKLYAYNPEQKALTQHRYTADSVFMIDALQTDAEGRLWIGSTSGLYCYNPQTKKGRKHALATSGTAVYNVVVQDGRYLWFSTPKEVVRYNHITETAEVLASNAFFPNSVISKRAFLLDAKGFLWVGTNKGFGKIDTRRFQTATGQTPPQLVDFSVFDQSRVFAEALPQLKKIVLQYNENFFSFAVSSFNFGSKAPVAYSYLLEGFDKDWQSTHGNSGSYTNVPPGRYALRLRSNTGSGGWVEKPDPILIEIKPPWWQRWWAISLMAVAAAFNLFALLRLRQKRKRKRQMDETIDYFANSLYGDNSVAEICWDIARNCISQLKLEDCVVYLLDEKRNRLVQKAAYGPKNPREHEIANPLEIVPGEGIVGTAAATAKPVLIKDTTKDSRYIVDDASRLSELAVPIVHDGQTIGVIDSEHSRKNFFTAEHLKVLSTIAAISANKIAEAKAEAAARESEIQLLEIKKLLAESQLMALRAQMNPHFVFNCLNSIQECIVTQKYGEASLYLNKFAKLFRSVLNNSGKVMVTLAEEIEVLELYLSLEHMRFEKSFTYTIDTDEELEADEILVPSMLLQPYVENALWHGLMHKPTDRKLCIAFRKKSETVFECLIEDNGIGRKKALELKAQQSKTKRHVSRGMTISQDRIDLLQKQGQHALLNIVDKTNEAGDATGTKVVIELSAFLQ